MEGNTFMSSIALGAIGTSLTAAAVGGVVAVVAAYGVVASQESAGTSEVNTSSVSYDG